MDPVNQELTAHAPARQEFASTTTANAADAAPAKQEFATAPKHDPARPYYGPLGDDVIYIAAVDDAQHGVDAGQPLIGKIVKVVKDDDENHVLVCNLTLFAHDSASLVFKAGAELGAGRGKFQFA